MGLAEDGEGKEGERMEKAEGDRKQLRESPAQHARLEKHAKALT